MHAISISKKKRSANARSQLLSSLMKAFSGDVGEDAANAFVKGDTKALQAAFEKARAKVLSDAEKKD